MQPETQSATSGFTDGGKSSWAKATGELLETGKDKEMETPSSLQEENSPADTLISVQ